jgi:pyruvate/2-oxoglutarate/acetoin dehydrogenase E1 component
MEHLLETDDRAVILGEDIVDPYGGAFKVTKGLSTKYPDRVLSMPISESAIVGASIGLAMQGLRPICEIMFGDFITLATDQIVNSATKFNWMYNEKVSVPLVVRTAVGGYRGYGPTHSQCLESMFLNVPGLDVVCPTPFGDPGTLLTSAYNTSNPTLFVEHKVNYPNNTNTQSTKRIGLLSVSRTPEEFPEYTLIPTHDQKIDLVVVAYGEVANMVAELSEELFLEEEIVVAIIVPTLLNSYLSGTTLESIRSSGKALVVEEGHKNFGWGSHISRSITDKCFTSLSLPVSIIGARQIPVGNASAIELETLPSKSLIKKHMLDITRW